MTCRFLVSGLVQGVGFRWYAARQARALGVAGYARNLSDGRVEVVASSEAPGALDALEQRLRAGPAHARVEAVQREDHVAAALPPGSFDIR